MTFLHPALIGIALAVGIAWMWGAPERVARGWIALLAGAAAAGIAGLAGWVPWTGPLTLAWHGIVIAAAFVGAWWLIRLRSRHLQLAPGTVEDQVLIALVAGLVGSRIWYVAERMPQFTMLPDGSPASLGQFLSRAADIDGGGMVWYGGLLLATAACWIHAHRNRIPKPGSADAIAPPLMLGLALGRVGCFINGCCYGLPSDLPWAYHHHDVHGRACTVHPTQLYEAAALTIAACILMWRTTALRLRPGLTAALALLAAGTFRLLNEILRGDTLTPFSLWPLHITNAQWTSLALIAGGAFWWWRISRHGQAAAPAQDGPR